MRRAADHSLRLCQLAAYRLIGYTIIGFIMIGKVTLAGSIAATEPITEIALYYLHERALAGHPLGAPVDRIVGACGEAGKLPHYG